MRFLLVLLCFLSFCFPALAQSTDSLDKYLDYESVSEWAFDGKEPWVKEVNGLLPDVTEFIKKIYPYAEQGYPRARLFTAYMIMLASNGDEMENVSSSDESRSYLAKELNTNYSALRDKTLLWQKNALLSDDTETVIIAASMFQFQSKKSQSKECWIKIIHCFENAHEKKESKTCRKILKKTIRESICFVAK